MVQLAFLARLSATENDLIRSGPRNPNMGQCPTHITRRVVPVTQPVSWSVGQSLVFPYRRVTTEDSPPTTKDGIWWSYLLLNWIPFSFIKMRSLIWDKHGIRYRWEGDGWLPLMFAIKPRFRGEKDEKEVSQAQHLHLDSSFLLVHYLWGSANMGH